jgi:hypothetical protein
MLSILRKARLKDKEMRILMLWVCKRAFGTDADNAQWTGQRREDNNRQEDHE